MKDRMTNNGRCSSTRESLVQKPLGALRFVRKDWMSYLSSRAPVHDDKVPSRWQLYQSERMDSDKLLWVDSVIGFSSEQYGLTPIFQSLQGNNAALLTPKDYNSSLCYFRRHNWCLAFVGFNLTIAIPQVWLRSAETDCTIKMARA